MKLHKLLVPTLLAFGVPLAGLAQNASGLSGPADQALDEELVYLSPFEVSAERANAYTVPVSTSGARIRQALIDTPATINVVSGEFIRDIGATSLIDATQYISGVGHSFLGGASGISDRQVIRGFGIYGSAIDNFVTMNSFQANLDPMVMDRIEIVKGPNAILAPTGAPGGSSTVFTKSPQFERSQTLRLELADEYFGNRIGYDITGPVPGTERFAYRVIAGYQDAHSTVPGKIINKTLNPMLTWAISPKAQLKLKGYLVNWRTEGAAVYPARLRLRPDVASGGVISLDSVDEHFVYDGANGASDAEFRDSHVRRGTVEFTTTLGEHLNLRLAALRHYSHQEAGGFGGSDDPNKVHPKERYNPMTGVYTPGQRWLLQNPSLPHDWVTNPYVATAAPEYGTYVSQRWATSRSHYFNEAHYQMDLAGRWEFGGVGRDALATLQLVVGGMRGRSYDKLRDRKSAPGSVPDWDFSKHPYPTDNPGRPDGVDSISRHLVNPRNTKTQAYGTTQLGLFKDRVLLSGGTSRIWVNRPDWLNMLTDTQGAPLRDHHDTPFYAALVKVLPQVSLYFSHSENAEAGLANNEVFWQKGEQEEVGLKLELFNGRLSITSAYFDLKQDRVITTNPLYFFDNTEPEYFLFDITNRGFELDIVGGITPNLTVIGSFTDMKLREPTGIPQPNIADTTYNGLLKYGFSRGPVKGLSVFAGFNHVGKVAGDRPEMQYTALAELAQISFYLPARTIYNAGASYDYGDLRLQLNVENLADKKTLWQANSRGNFAGYPGRNVRLTLTYSF
ncbi:hypothetical protein AXK11_01420 [Cephaloticoccus primus]|uniref:TonB-dependent receptor plug domain-containing protein n=1 Tax=Cephaloticoccus primus TaxID=1548207 RepID=A0A139STT5_9BACT|nr:TonB-dependent receptor plug domain-containing protein [Cephaloticoccus primus]KXU37986.1 hypothetical protein AXK11_01420 [Cephaloticoccus primus]